MGRSRWSLLGLIAAGSLVAGSCAGALAGNYTVTGGLYPRAGWSVPNFGTDDEVAHLPPAAAIQRVEQAPQYPGYYPAQVPVASSPDYADAAAREFDRLYDEPVYAQATHVQTPEVADDWPEPSAPSADVAAYADSYDEGDAAD